MQLVSEEIAKELASEPGMAHINFITYGTTEKPLVLDQRNFAPDFINVGEGRDFYNYADKVEAILLYARSVPPEDLIVYMDGNDAWWGGCTEDDLNQRYTELVQKTGAPIIMGAELSCGEQECNAVPDVPDWAIERSGISDLASGRMLKFSACQTMYEDDVPTEEDFQRCSCSLGPPGTSQKDCSKTLPYKYLNSGFMAGPAGKMIPMLEWIHTNYNQQKGTDQYYFAQYWRDHPTEVSLDYLGELGNTIKNFGTDAFYVEKSDPERKNWVYNQAFNAKKWDKPLCAIHYNYHPTPGQIEPNRQHLFYNTSATE